MLLFSVVREFPFYRGSNYKKVLLNIGDGWLNRTITFKTQESCKYRHNETKQNCRWHSYNFNTRYVERFLRFLYFIRQWTTFIAVHAATSSSFILKVEMFNSMLLWTIIIYYSHLPVDYTVLLGLQTVGDYQFLQLVWNLWRNLDMDSFPRIETI